MPDRFPSYEFEEPRRRPSALIEDVLRRLSFSGKLTGAAADDADVNQVERTIGVRFPPDYRHFLLTAGGDSKQQPWRGLWRVSELVSLNRDLPLFRWFRGIVGIGNEGFIVTALDYRDGPEPVVVHVGLSSSDEGDITREADTFAEWLERTLE